jgi:hypothetical protein
MARSDFLPSPPRSLALARRFRLATERAGPPKFLGDPSPHMPRATIPAEPSKQASGAAPLRMASTVLPSTPTSASASATTNFGTEFRSLRARCLRFVTTVARVLPHGHARLASGWWPSLAGRDSNPLGRKPGFCLVLAYTFTAERRIAAGGDGEPYRAPVSRLTVRAARSRRALDRADAGDEWGVLAAAMAIERRRAWGVRSRRCVTEGRSAPGRGALGHRP